MTALRIWIIRCSGIWWQMEWTRRIISISSVSAWTSISMEPQNNTVLELNTESVPSRERTIREANGFQ